MSLVIFFSFSISLHEYIVHLSNSSGDKSTKTIIIKIEIDSFSNHYIVDKEGYRYFFFLSTLVHHSYYFSSAKCILISSTTVRKYKKRKRKLNKRKLDNKQFTINRDE